MDALTIWDVVSRGGLPAAMALIIWSGVKQLWVWGWLYRDAISRIDQMRLERDEWKSLALRSTHLAQEATATAAAATRGSKP